MRVEVLQARHPLGHLRVGAIIKAMPDGQAGDLARRGIVKVLHSPADRMARADSEAAHGGYVTKGRRR